MKTLQKNRFIKKITAGWTSEFVFHDELKIRDFRDGSNSRSRVGNKKKHIPILGMETDSELGGA
jgi:hypothetical protein